MKTRIPILLATTLAFSLSHAMESGLEAGDVETQEAQPEVSEDAAEEVAPEVEATNGKAVVEAAEARSTGKALVEAAEAHGGGKAVVDGALGKAVVAGGHGKAPHAGKLPIHLDGLDDDYLFDWPDHDWGEWGHFVRWKHAHLGASYPRLVSQANPSFRTRE